MENDSEKLFDVQSYWKGYQFPLQLALKPGLSYVDVADMYANANCMTPNLA